MKASLFEAIEDAVPPPAGGNVMGVASGPDN
jgi:hypothetical protein